MTLKINNISFDDRKKMGNRIKGARMMVGLKQEEFAKKYDLSLSTLKNFEVARFAPKRGTILQILDALNNEGLSVDEHWLITGSHAAKSPSKIPDTHKANPKRLEEISLLLEFMTSQGLEPVSTTVINNDMAPHYLNGDVLIGVPVSKAELSAQKLSSRGYLVEANEKFEPFFLIHDAGVFHGVNNSKTKLLKLKNERLASIVWHCPNSAL